MLISNEYRRWIADKERNGANREKVDEMMLSTSIMTKNAIKKPKAQEMRDHFVSQ